MFERFKIYTLCNIISITMVYDMVIQSNKASGANLQKLTQTWTHILPINIFTINVIFYKIVWRLQFLISISYHQKSK